MSATKGDKTALIERTAQDLTFFHIETKTIYSPRNHILETDTVKKNIIQRTAGGRLSAPPPPQVFADSEKNGGA